MKKIGVAGLQRELIKKTIENTAPGCFEVFIYNDMEAAMKVKNGQLDYYIGACNTGAGAALSLRSPLSGSTKVALLLSRVLRRKRLRLQKWWRKEESRLAFRLNILNMRSHY